MSRCCVNGTCTHFLNCYQRCETNAECTDPMTSCCSQGYCTDNIVCEGNKSIGDVCDHSWECMSGYCEPALLVCMANNQAIKLESDKYIWLMAIIFVGLALMIFICLRKWFTNRFCSDG